MSQAILNNDNINTRDRIMDCYNDITHKTNKYSYKQHTKYIYEMYKTR